MRTISARSEMSQDILKPKSKNEYIEKIPDACASGVFLFIPYLQELSARQESPAL